MEAVQPELYPLEVSLHRIKTSWGGWPGRVGEIWSLSGPPHESLILNGPLAGRWLTEIVGNYQQRLLGEDVELDPREPFHFQIKFVLAAKDLSVEVHPTEAHTMEKRLPMVGLDKVWYILGVKPGSLLYLGFKDRTGPGEIERALQDRSFPQRLNAFPAKPGEVYLVPAGRVHAVGKGVKLLEIQRHSSLTCELFRWDGKDPDPCPDLPFLETNAVSPDPVPAVTVGEAGNTIEYLACTPRFLLRRLVVHDSLEVPQPGRRMRVYTGLRGAGWLRWGFSDICSYIQPYQSVLVPAIPEDLFFESDGVLEVLETSVPDMAGETLSRILDLGIPRERIISLGGDDYCGILRNCLPGGGK
jgi:mannose-6-phosphate isomerase class I